MRKLKTPKKLVIESRWEDIAAEVSAVLERNGAQPDLTVLASIALNNHPKVRGKDADWHLCASFRALRKEISDQLNRRRRKADPEAEAQMEFECLKQSYNVDRDGRQLNLGLEVLTFEEIMATVKQYRAQIKTMGDEADALQRYAFQKFPEKATQFMAEQETEAAL
jgi:hypothetical protein